ncbi:site-specific integrase [Ginsengibacter hankyongi]|uniref:Site-specific integrase n=1 Tax=Ginsengibacter hankyongi TaxID=2607284 RepID=A0A5J5IFY2_9BACT|nr:site-specific integrase [Ginsengibacter hankyongi]KAA9036563.1 site-specific integrase [Ginsengibacter hankyongi]
MQTQLSFSILFWIKKNRMKNGKAPIYARVTINGNRLEISAQREISVVGWNPGSQKVRGKSAEANMINNDLAFIKTKILSCRSRLEARNEIVSIESFKKEYAGVVERPRMLMEIIQQHNNDIKTLIDKGYSKATWVKYNTTYRHIREFLKWKFNIADINLKKLNFEFITDFEFYLKSQKNIDVNTNAKYIKNIKKIVRECVSKNWLDKDPFMAYKVKAKKTDREFLSELELQTIHEKEFTIERLQHIKDLFLFSCYTGLAYIDIYNLTANNISIGIDGEKWIFTHRQKTETPSRIPLLQPALDILDQYSNHPVAVAGKRLLPVPSNQRMNSYLKEIAAICGINKKLTFHVARHTFATTVTLTNGVPIESISKMLGHTKIQTTQIYAKILDKKVSNDMQALRRKFQVSSKIIDKKIG